MREEGQETAETTTTAPATQKIQRLQTLEKEHKDALERAVSLNIPHAVASEDEPAAPILSQDEDAAALPDLDGEKSGEKAKTSDDKTNWNVLVQTMLHKESGNLHLKKGIDAPE